MNKELDQLIAKQDLDIIQFTNDFCEIVKEHYGSHNYSNVKNIVNKRLAKGANSSEATAILPHVSVSLRDFFAAEAMKAECISWNAEMSNKYRAKILKDMIERWGKTTVYEAIALNSWEMADNMLKAKSRYER